MTGHNYSFENRTHYLWFSASHFDLYTTFYTRFNRNRSLIAWPISLFFAIQHLLVCSIGDGRRSPRRDSLELSFDHSAEFRLAIWNPKMDFLRISTSEMRSLLDAYVMQMRLIDSTPHSIKSIATTEIPIHTNLTIQLQSWSSWDERRHTWRTCISLETIYCEIKIGWKHFCFGFGTKFSVYSAVITGPVPFNQIGDWWWGQTDHSIRIQNGDAINTRIMTWMSSCRSILMSIVELVLTTNEREMTTLWICFSCSELNKFRIEANQINENLEKIFFIEKHRTRSIMIFK